MRRFIYLSMLLGSMTSAQAQNPNISPAAANRPADEIMRVESSIKTLASDMAAKCPVSARGDEQAFDACRLTISNDSPLTQILGAVTLWGRMPADPNVRLKDYHTTQFAPEVLSGMYMPLFMYTGQYKVEFNPNEQLYRVQLGATFRNELKPGNFPYPFWHEDNKWSQYQDAKTIVLWINPETMKARNAHFTPTGDMEFVPHSKTIKHDTFNGKWVWADEQGQQQPKLTLFDGMYSANNPYLQALDASYREFALSLRAGQCMTCHVPNNPNKMKNLVLMQSPRHAAAEIERIMSDVNRDKMPVTEWGDKDPLSPEVKAIFVTRGEAFEAAVKSARAWESANPRPALGGPLVLKN